MKPIIIHQAICGAEYLSNINIGHYLRSCSILDIPSHNIDSNTDKNFKISDINYPIIKSWQEEFGWCEAKIWTDDEPERRVIRNDHRIGYCRSHILIWPDKETANKYRHLINHQDPATIGDGKLVVKLEPIDLSIILNKEQIMREPKYPGKKVCPTCDRSMDYCPGVGNYCHVCPHPATKQLDEIKTIVERLLENKSINTRFVNGKYTCPECGESNDTNLKILRSIPSLIGSFDFVKHADDCLFSRLIKAVRKKTT